MNPLIKANAVNMLKQYQIKRHSEFDLYEIMNAEGLLIQRVYLENSIGSISYDSRGGIVSIDANITDEKQSRFIAAHEFGHFVNEREKSGYFRCNGEMIFGTNTNLTLESNASRFGVELIMFEDWFLKFIKGKRFGVQLIKDISDYFGVSLSSSALRYAELGYTPMAVILSQNGKVVWNSINKSFCYSWIPKGYKVNNLSYAYDFFEGKEIPDFPETILADAWFLEDRTYRKDHFLLEHNIPMPRYDAVLSIVWEG
ncbi:MAG TPA: ImmA/IrrE family metallo-endopeptidase [Ignavibacteriaceae bacterium]|nr:ImmA/IrrE family metallo-endopeptidase [Ignavibacteriaceae bacterium]